MATEYEYWGVYLHTYGINSLLMQLAHYESVENYEECEVIKAVIDNHNLVATVKLKTRL
jgi:hypothetical protein